MTWDLGKMTNMAEREIIPMEQIGALNINRNRGMDTIGQNGRNDHRIPGDLLGHIEGSQTTSPGFRHEHLRIAGDGIEVKQPAIRRQNALLMQHDGRIDKRRISFEYPLMQHDESERSFR